MAKRKPLTKKQILEQVRGTVVLKKYSKKSPFTTLATISNYALWKNMQADIDELEEYNGKMAVVYEETEDPDVLEEMCEHLMEAYQIELTVTLHTPADWLKYKSNKFLMQQVREQCLSVNELFITERRYMAACLTVLEQLGKDAKYIQECKDHMVEYMDDKFEPKMMREELKEETGLCIEEPER